MNEQGDLFTYPHQPGFKRVGTSKDAAEAIKPRVQSLREKAFIMISSAGPAGLTADEVADILNRSVLSIRPRCSELLLLGRIVRNGKRRQNKSGLYADAYIINGARP